MRKKKTLMFKPNLIDSKEVAYIKQKHPKVDIPNEIPLYNKGAYNFISLKLLRKGGIDYEIKVRVFTMDPVQFLSMKEEEKDAMVSMHEHCIIIHDPTKEDTDEEVEVDNKIKTGRLTDAKKKKIIKAFKEYVEQQEGDEVIVSEEFIEEISEKNNVPADKIAELLSSLPEY